MPLNAILRDAIPTIVMIPGDGRIPSASLLIVEFKLTIPESEGARICLIERLDVTRVSCSHTSVPEFSGTNHQFIENSMKSPISAAP